MYSKDDVEEIFADLLTGVKVWRCPAVALRGLQLHQSP